jgi:hypothetical protein
LQTAKRFPRAQLRQPWGILFSSRGCHDHHNGSPLGLHDFFYCCTAKPSGVRFAPRATLSPRVSEHAGSLSPSRGRGHRARQREMLTVPRMDAPPWAGTDARSRPRGGARPDAGGRSCSTCAFPALGASRWLVSSREGTRRARDRGTSPAAREDQREDSTPARSVAEQGSSGGDVAGRVSRRCSRTAWAASVRACDDVDHQQR